MYLARVAGDNTIADDAAALLLQGDCVGAYNLLTAPTCETDIVLTTNSEMDYCVTNSLTSTAVLGVTDIIAYKAENTILLEPGFTVVAGAQLTATIEECCSDSPITQLEQVAAKFILPNKKEKIIAQALQVSPNPFDGTITLGFNATTKVAVLLFNSIGQLEWQGSFAANQHFNTINTNSLQAGIYFVQVVEAGKIVASEKVVKVAN